MENGKYGPYYQRQRAEIYQAFAKKLVSEGKAYPCFCSEEELGKLREQQTSLNQATGYYGKWAKCRNLTLQEIKARLENKDSYVIRMRSNGDNSKQHIFHDEIKGDITVHEGTFAISANAIASSLQGVITAAGLAAGNLAVTIVGQSIGRGAFPDARRYGYGSIALGLGLLCYASPWGWTLKACGSPCGPSGPCERWH